MIITVIINVMESSQYLVCTTDDWCLRALADDMPLGKLSKKTILEAYSVLSDIAALLNEPPGPKRAVQIRDASTRFATVIPQARERARTHNRTASH